MQIAISSLSGPLLTSPAMKPMSRPSKPTATILVVDPSPITLIAMAGTLDAQGYACICARSHEAATKAIAQDPIDAIVVDVGDDAEAVLAWLARLRQSDETAGLPAVIVADACWAGLQQRCEGLSSGAKGSVRCLFKPIDPNALLDIVHQSLWMPQLLSGHRRRGTRPTRPGWVGL